MTVPDELYLSLEDVPEGFEKGTYDRVMRRTLSGGKFAVMRVKRDGKNELGFNIMKARQRFSAWLHESKYIRGGHQYLEEHLSFSETDERIGSVDLYISVQDAPKQPFGAPEEAFLPAFRAAVFTSHSGNPEENRFESRKKPSIF